MLEEVCPNARDRAAAEAMLRDDAFPAACPFTLGQVTGDRLPDA